MRVSAQESARVSALVLERGQVRVLAQALGLVPVAE